MSASRPLGIAIFGLSLTSAWGNGHATTYRALIRALAKRGHHVAFYERDQPWYAAHRDLPEPDFCELHLYDALPALEQQFGGAIHADLVIIGSFVPEGARLADWALTRARGITAFYDIDTPVTLAQLDRGRCSYLSPELITEFDLYLSFTGGPILRRLQRVYGAHRPRPLYCSVDSEQYRPLDLRKRFDLGYLGTYSEDRQPKLEQLLLKPARRWREGRFCVAGAQYPESISWPANVLRTEHLPPPQHPGFYNEQRFTLNVTRDDMVESGYSPSVRLFEASACGVPIISDAWNGLEEFFEPGQEILIAHSPEESLRYLRDLSASEAQQIGERARARVLAEHTGDHRARELENYVAELSPRQEPGLEALHAG